MEHTSSSSSSPSSSSSSCYPKSSSHIMYRTQMITESSKRLCQFMDNERLLPSGEEETKREDVIDNLKKLVEEWIKMVAYLIGYSEDYIEYTSATIMVHGSYGLGAHDSESDIDALCIGPFFVTLAEDFFISLHNMLASRPEVSEILCVKDARVPLIRFKFDGITIDLTYAKFNRMRIPEEVDVFDLLYLINIDEISWRSLSGVRANKTILQHVPANLVLYRLLLRCVKFWAKRRGIYGHAQGFLGGIHLAVLAAFVCRRQPYESLHTLVLNFFQTFAFWPWPKPVILDRDLMPYGLLPSNNSSILMPIQLPSGPNEYCYSNITRSTLDKIIRELLYAHVVVQDNLWPDFDWKILFEPFPYAKKYERFLKIHLSCPIEDELREWVGKVKSRMRYLLIKLEELQGFCDPNPTEYVETDKREANKVFYWGLCPGTTCNINVDAIEEDFMRNICSGWEGPIGSLELKVVGASTFPTTCYWEQG